MLSVTNLSLRFSDRKLFDDVNLKFTKGNCYGVIGANGAGKSTLLRILEGELEPTAGDVFITPGERLAVLRQDHFAYDDESVIDTVIMGHERLRQIMAEKDALYAKEDFSEKDGIKAAELEGEFAEMNGWDAETDAEKLLVGLGIMKDAHGLLMRELAGGEKVKVLLAQALFGNPDILLMDEPTNHLDFTAINWLEEFLINYENTVVVVSHDRHFLNMVCTHMVDVDFGKVHLFVGNYDFWYESSQLALKLMKDQNKKSEEKIKELEKFIARFSSNASKAKQATSRKKLLDKINVEDIVPSSRRYPFVGFKPNRETGKDILFVEGLTKTVDGAKVLDDISFTLNKNDKVIFVSKNKVAVTTLFKILAGEMEADEGKFKWGVTTSQAYLPNDNAKWFEDVDINLIDWLRQFSEEKEESFIRGFLGRMLFSGEEPMKKVPVLSGGEKVRCMFSKMMLSGSNVLILDEPTNHLDLESIQAVNDGLQSFNEILLFSSHDHKFVESISNRVIELTPSGVYDRVGDFDEFLANEEVQASIEKMYK
ncbi:MAG: ATP-binding cassette domain-containing protein [Peptostreptococcaceae bacterium]|nr:ATP-binding cassette domain-containing protein [Peptostreptococcaceae bacterium]